MKYGHLFQDRNAHDNQKEEQIQFLKRLRTEKDPKIASKLISSLHFEMNEDFQKNLIELGFFNDLKNILSTNHQDQHIKYIKKQ